jgi:hypothetical protein
MDRLQKWHRHSCLCVPSFLSTNRRSAGTATTDKNVCATYFL